MGVIHTSVTIKMTVICTRFQILSPSSTENSKVPNHANLFFCTYETVPDI